MITWPAIVPTVDEESPEASSEIAKMTLAAEPSSGSSVRCASSIEAISVQPLLPEGRGGHDQHRGVDQPGDAHRDHDVDQLEAEEPVQLLRIARHDPVLGQRRVQEDDVRHHGRAEDADRQQDALGPVEPRA